MKNTKQAYADVDTKVSETVSGMDEKSFDQCEDREQKRRSMHLDPEGLHQIGKKALTISLGGINLPFTLGVGPHLCLEQLSPKAMAMSEAAANDVATWILLALAIALSGTRGSAIVSLWIARQCPRGEPVDEIYICATLVAIFATGFVTDIIGIDAHFGAFVLAVLVPKKGAFAYALVEKVDDLLSGMFIPLYFVSSG
ncbi:Cation/H(+) antiporter 18 [Sesamum alatum]|uniref:Cation/H(+) antiporter 18 n=1 Tax=Sesamum alatum TaxID=300844 RepID=A0AAE1Y3T7_9LAMI|nr:Cation/H(+) antiporter 18 [Sesamum alatum]